jgi:tRNA pseudouridine55 synthase
VSQISNELPIDGLLLIDKPVGISSFDVIRVLRRQTGIRKIGHAGTLDPLASGLMLMLFGAGCKRAEVLTKLDKRYEARLVLGANSTTGDDEGEKILINDIVPSLSQVQATLAAFTGDLSQVPSAYSAIKIRGKEAYKRVRAGEHVEMPRRQITVHENTLVAYNYPSLAIATVVSSGTYIRTLAEDMGKMLGTGAYLDGLVRTMVGGYKLEAALELAAVDGQLARERILEI